MQKPFYESDDKLPVDFSVLMKFLPLCFRTGKYHMIRLRTFNSATKFLMHLSSGALLSHLRQVSV